MKEVMERVLAYTMRKRMLVPLPFWLAKLQGAILQLLPNPPLTLDQVRLLENDNVVSEAAKRDSRTLEGLGIVEPVAVEAVVPDYLEQYPPAGQFSIYRPAQRVDQHEQEAAERHAVEHEGQQAHAPEQRHEEGDGGKAGDEGEDRGIERIHGDGFAARRSRRRS